MLQVLGFNLISGIEIVGEVESARTNSVKIFNAVLIDTNVSASVITISPLTHAIDISKPYGLDIEVKQEHILFNYIPKQDLIDQYTKIVHDIVTKDVSKEKNIFRLV